MLNQLYGMAWVYQLVMWVILVQAGYTAAPQCLYVSMCLNVSMCVNVFAGLASALGLLKERGRLNMESHMVWAGRTNDRSKNALQGLVGE